LTSLRERPAWRALERHHAQVAGRHLRDLFATEKDRGERLVAEAAGLHLDFSKNRITDETGEYEVIGRPYTTATGKNAHVRVKRVDQSEVTMVRVWGAHERIAVKRGT